MPWGAGSSGLAVVANTPVGGVPLTNAQTTFLTWTAPSDGKLHVVEFALALVTTVQEVGGAIAVAWTIGGVPGSDAVIGGNQVPGSIQAINGAGTGIVVDPGSTINVGQSNLTAGAAKFFGVLYAA